MKRANDEYLKIIIYIIFGIVFVVSTYLVIINIHHYKSLSQEIVVSEIDIDYKNFKSNINKIEDKLNDYKDDKNITSLKNTLAILKNGGIFRLIPSTKITYYDLYILNNYFMNDIIDNCWVVSLKGLNKDENNDKIVNLLINNSKYLDSHFNDNGIILYDSYNIDSIKNDYNMILKNYLSFSDVLLSIIGGEVDGNN